jgi:hypothetical protein
MAQAMPETDPSTFSLSHRFLTIILEKDSTVKKAVKKLESLGYKVSLEDTTCERPVLLRFINQRFPPEF